MTGSKLLDSSVWLAYLFNGAYSDVIDSEEVHLLSSLSLFEIKKKLIKSKIESGKIRKSMEFVRKRSLVIPVSEDIAEKAVDISFENGLSIIDSLIYTTSIIQGASLMTLDNDFRGLKNTIVL